MPGRRTDDFTVYYTSAERWDQGYRNSNWYLDARRPRTPSGNG
jgi:hypothetical protein